jgi:hypothetical protein
VQVTVVSLFLAEVGMTRFRIATAGVVCEPLRGVVAHATFQRHNPAHFAMRRQIKQEGQTVTGSTGQPAVSAQGLLITFGDKRGIARPLLSRKVKYLVPFSKA